MTINFPDSIRIGSVDYCISRKKGLSANSSLWGEIAYGRAEISVEESLPPSKAKDILSHELAHGILYEAGYEEHSEEQANRVGKVLAMLLRDNDFTFMREDV